MKIFGRQKLTFAKTFFGNKNRTQVAKATCSVSFTPWLTLHIFFLAVSAVPPFIFREIAQLPSKYGLSLTKTMFYKLISYFN